MKLAKILALAVALMLFLIPLAACSGSPAPKQSASAPANTEASTPTPAPAANINIKTMAFRPVDSLQSGVSKSLSDFSLDLFRRMAAQGSGKNVFISPLSVWLALSMTYNGASGSTSAGMAQALHAAGISLSDLNAANAGLMGVLTASDPKVQISIADSIWIRKGLELAFSPDFLDRDQQYYAAQIKALDFGDAKAADTINSWVEKNTNGNIKGLVQPPIDPATVMFLINAVHFKAPWKVSFDPKKTFDGVFTTSGGIEVSAKFLSNEEDNCGYADGDIAAVRIPYASGRLEMVAVMPEKQALGDFVKALTPDALQSYIDKCEDGSLPLTFPKFKVEYSATLNDALASMGMGDAFDASKADFTNMSQEMGKQLVISKVNHKSFIQVDEQGTEASAATSVEMRVTAVLNAPTLDFTKPFVYLIRDTKTGAILFIGTMENPA